MDIFVVFDPLLLMPTVTTRLLLVCTHRLNSECCSKLFYHSQKNQLKIHILMRISSNVAAVSVYNMSKRIIKFVNVYRQQK